MEININQTIQEALFDLMSVVQSISDKESKQKILQGIYTLGSHLATNFDEGFGDTVLVVYKDGSKAFWKSSAPHMLRD